MSVPLLIPTMAATLLTSILSSSLAFTATNAWVPSLSPKTNIREQSRLHYTNHLQDDYWDRAEAAEPLPLSTQDLDRFSEMSSRGTTMPVVILDCILPGQKIYFQR